MTTATTETEGVRVQVRLPLPLDLASSLTKAVGLMYPGSDIRTDTPDYLTFVVPNGDRAKGRGGKRKIAAQRVREDDPDQAPEMRQLRDADGTLTLTAGTPQEATVMLGVWAKTILEATDGAINYVEQEITVRDSGRKFVVIACWTPEQTPHQLRMAAERRAAEAEAEVARLTALLAGRE